MIVEVIVGEVIFGESNAFRIVSQPVAVIVLLSFHRKEFNTSTKNLLSVLDIKI